MFTGIDLQATKSLRLFIVAREDPPVWMTFVHFWTMRAAHFLEKQKVGRLLRKRRNEFLNRVSGGPCGVPREKRQGGTGHFIRPSACSRKNAVVAKPVVGSMPSGSVP